MTINLTREDLSRLSNPAHPCSKATQFSIPENRPGATTVSFGVPLANGEHKVDALVRAAILWSLGK